MTTWLALAGLAVALAALGLVVAGAAVLHGRLDALESDRELAGSLEQLHGAQAVAQPVETPEDLYPTSLRPSLRALRQDRAERPR